MNKKAYAASGFLIIALTTILHFIFARSIDFRTDEGWWTLGAKNMLVHHVRLLRFWETVSQAPIATFMLYAWQALVGFGISNSRTFIIILTAIQGVCLLILVTRKDGPLEAALVLLYLAFEPMVQSLSFSVYLEPIAAIFNTSALLLLLSPDKTARRLAFIPIVFGLGTKVTEMWISMFCLFLIALTEEKERKKEYGLVLLISSVLVAALYGIIYSFRPEIFVSTWSQFFHATAADPMLEASWISRTAMVSWWFLRQNIVAALFIVTIFFMRKQIPAAATERDEPNSFVPVAWFLLSVVVALATSGGRAWRFYGVFFPLGWIFAREAAWLVRNYSNLTSPHRQVLAILGILSFLAPGASMVRQFHAVWGELRKSEDVIAWANTHVETSDVAVAPAYLGANFRFPTLDLRDINDSSDRFLPDSEELAQYRISYAFCDQREWLLWAKRGGYTKDLERFLTQDFKKVLTIDSTEIWQRRP
jgi:hypothetical protein